MYVIKRETCEAGLDFSLTCPALAIRIKDGDVNPHNCHFYFNILKPTKKNQEFWSLLKGTNIFPTFQEVFDTDQIARYNYLSQWVIAKLKEYNVNKVYLEGYSYASSGMIFNIAEATGILKKAMYDEGIEFDLIPPANHKRIFCGKGNATKEFMINQFKEEYMSFVEIDYFTTKINPGSDIVDAFSLLYTGIKGENEKYESKTS